MCSQTCDNGGVQTTQLENQQTASATVLQPHMDPQEGGNGLAAYGPWAVLPTTQIENHQTPTATGLQPKMAPKAGDGPAASGPWAVLPSTQLENDQ